MPVLEQPDLAFRHFVLSVCFVAKRYILQQKVSIEVNGKLRARNKTVGLQLLTFYTDPQSHSA